MSNLEREGAVVDEVLHHQCRGQTLHPGESGQVLVVEPLERGKIPLDGPHEVVGLTEQSLGLDDLWHPGEGLLEGADRPPGLLPAA